MIEIFNEVVVGMVALGLIFAVFPRTARASRKDSPGFWQPYCLGPDCISSWDTTGISQNFRNLPLRQACACRLFPGFLTALPRAIQYLPMAIPFGILTIIGGINNTESARLAGDEYRTRDILLTEAFTSLIAAFFGGVAQTTPYIGHPAYKKMGAT